MTDRAHIEAICKTLAAEHDLVVQLIERIRADDSREDLHRHLRRLRELLIVHFGHEQLSGGLYETMGRMLEGHDAELVALMDEHQAILGEMSALVERVGAADGDDGDEFGQAIADLLASITEHERREQEFVATLLGS
jgi:hypothetical protein